MSKTDTKALFKISYGLYVLTTEKDGKNYGCIINTPVQITDNPCRLTIAVSKENYTTNIIKETNKFNVSILTKKTPFSTIENFGFKSSKDTDKFKNTNYKKSKNNVAYLTDNTNAFLSFKVISYKEVGTHILFLADLVESEVLSEESSLTYEYYHKNIKPAPKKTDVKGYRCRICGFIYEGEPLPDGYICPICKHGVEAFDKIG